VVICVLILKLVIGEWQVKIDSKGRFLFPAGLRKQLPPSSSNVFVINRGFEKCLNIFPYEFWNSLISRINQSLNLFNAEHRAFYRKFVNGAKVMELDQAGRLLVPAPLLEYAEIKEEAVLLAYADRIEMWNITRYNEEISQISESEFGKMAEKILGKTENKAPGDNK